MTTSNTFTCARVSRLVEDFQVILATEDDETRDYLKRFCSESICYELGESDTEDTPDIKFQSDLNVSQVKPNQ